MLLRQFPTKAAFFSLTEKCNVIPVCAEILADTETPVSVLKKLYRPENPLFLFESVEGGEHWGRFSFMGTAARTHVRVYPENVEIRENGDTRVVAHHGDPLSVLRDLMQAYVPADIPGLPRFWGGLVGYFTYESVSFFEKIPNNHPPDKPLAHFIIPDEILIFDNIRNTLQIVALAFTGNDEPPAQTYRSAISRIQGLLEQMAQPLPRPAAAPLITDLSLTPDGDDESFRADVRRVKEHIRAGDIIQAVISRKFTCDAPADIWALYRAQRYINPSPYLYFLNLDDMALIGSSPETMVRLENQVATLRPIAGTRPRGETEQLDRSLADELLSDEKERAEHLMLVDLGRNDLGRIAETGTVQVTDLMFVERYSHVMHLVSNICCDLKTGHDAWDLLRATFPAGTLSGAPKIRAMEIIHDHEQKPRGPYGGAVGYVSFNGNMDMAIVIRTACIQNGLLTVQAGAGIVADSDPEAELQETVNKAMALQKALELVRNSN
jgi:anthranilate synthase component I